MKGEQLIFISRILRNGLGVEKVHVKDEVLMKHLNKIDFKMISLSITEHTWIAAEFNCYVVKIKK